MPIRTSLAVASFVLLASVLPALASDHTVLPTETPSLGWTVLSYDADVTIAEPANRRIAGTNRIRVLRRAGTTDTVLMLHLRVEERTPTRALVDGLLVPIERHGSVTDADYHYRIPLGRRSEVDRTHTVEVLYDGVMDVEPGAAPWGGVSYEDSTLYALGVCFHCPWVSATQHWLPVFDHPSQKATFTLRVTVPRSLVAVSNGRCTDTIATTDGMHTFVWEQDEPCATYLLTLAVGPFVEVDIAEAPVAHTAWVLRRDSAAARRSFRLLPRMRQTFERAFGPYPFAKVGYVATRKGAMEHQSLIAINTDLVRAGDSVFSTAAHELAHQWFGDLVSPVDFRHAWLTEAFATYCEHLWAGELYGRSDYLLGLSTAAGTYLSRIAQREGVFPLFDFPRAAPSSNYPETIYKKGAVVVGMLRAYVGDTAFFRGLASYLQQHAYGNAGTDDLMAAFDRETDRDVAAFFDQWVRSAGWPKLSLDIARDGAADIITVRQVQQTTDPSWPIFTTLPLNVTYLDAVTGALVDTIVAFDAEGVARIRGRDIRLNTGQRSRCLLDYAGSVSVAGPQGLRQSITIAPNPVTATAHITIDGPLTGVAVRIGTMDGRTIRNLDVPPDHAGPWSASVDCSGMAPGVYDVQLVQDGSIRHLPLVIVR